MATTTPLTTTVQLSNAVCICTGTLVCRADPLSIQAWPHNHTYARVTPATTVPTHAVRAEWGGIVICRTSTSLLEDLETLTDFGFRILGREERAGETHVFVFGSETLCRAWVSDVQENKRLRAHFAPYPYGERILTTGIRANWNDGRRLIV
jgi:hypothetical protein